MAMIPDLMTTRPDDTFGKARFLTLPEAIQLSLNQRWHQYRERPIVGWLTNQEGHTPLPIYSADGNGHLMTVAVTRAGKGTSQIVPNLLSMTSSILVLDVKGENYKLTAGYRCKKLEQKIQRFSPFESQTDVFNPFVCLHVSPNPTGSEEEQEDISYFVSLICEPNPKANEPFWDHSAANFIEGLITYVATSKLNADVTNEAPEYVAIARERSMQEVNRLLHLGKKPFEALLRYMVKDKRPIIQQAGEGMVDMLGGDGRMGRSVLAIAREKLHVWSDYRVRRATYQPSRNSGDLEPGPNSIEFKDLRDPQGTTIYLCIPPDAITRYKPILRAMVGWAMRELRMNAKAEDKKRSVLFMLDEFPQLGYMQPIEAALLYLAGYGVRFWFFIQDISQLALHYPHSWQTFVANSSTQVFFGVNDLETARLISSRIGTTTVDNMVYSLNSQKSTGGGESHSSSSSSGSGPGGSTSSSTTGDSYSTSWSYSDGSGISWNPVARELLKPEEVLPLPYEVEIVFMRPHPPLLCHKIDYFLINQLRKSAEILPPHPISFD
jgi:type IV secretion system protein VirD4